MKGTDDMPLVKLHVSFPYPLKNKCHFRTCKSTKKYHEKIIFHFYSGKPKTLTDFLGSGDDMPVPKNISEIAVLSGMPAEHASRTVISFQDFCLLELILTLYLCVIQTSIRLLFNHARQRISNVARNSLTNGK